MRSLPRSRAAAFIALAAMLMLFIAPLISKSLAQVAACHQSAQHVSMNAPMEGVSVSVADTSEAHGKHGGTHPDMAMSHGGQSLLEDIACGYCHILIHLSLILVIVQPLIWLLFLSFKALLLAIFFAFICPNPTVKTLPERRRLLLFHSEY